MTRYLLLLDYYGLVSVGRPLWREDESVFYICCWPLPAQCFSGPSPLGLATIIYCLSFETSLFVASYDSQGHGGGIRRRLHTGSPIVIVFSSKSFYMIRQWPHRKHRLQQLFYCFVYISRRRQIFRPAEAISCGCTTDYLTHKERWLTNLSSFFTTR
jgi:hypothetical protein